MQIVGHELVVALEVMIGDIKKQRAILGFGALAQHRDRALVTFEQRRQQRRNERLFQNFRQRLGNQQRNEPRHKAVVLSGLDYHGQLHGRRFHFYRGLGVGIHGAVDDIGPVHQIGYRSGIETETLLRNGGDEAGAGLEIGIVKLAVALVLLEVGGVCRREERALVMVEPPSDFGRTGILEVHDSVFVAVKLLLVKQGSGAVQQAGKNEADVVADAFPVKTRKQSG